MRLISALAFAALLSAGVAQAQTAAPANPLRPAPKVAPAAAPAATPTPAATAPAAETPKDAAKGTKRTRSEAQLANDKRMRACGAEWKANKAKLMAEGKTWRTYMPECRARMKAAGQ
jgi:hypothetical protein